VTVNISNRNEYVKRKEIKTHKERRSRKSPQKQMTYASAHATCSQIAGTTGIERGEAVAVSAATNAAAADDDDDERGERV
jgi:hypothetical protein